MATAPRSTAKGTDPEQPSFEAAMAELEQIVARIEQREVSLEESMTQFQRGAALIKRCREVLLDAERRIEQITAAELAAGGTSAASNLGKRS